MSGAPNVNVSAMSQSSNGDNCVSGHQPPNGEHQNGEHQNGGLQNGYHQDGDHQNGDHQNGEADHGVINDGLGMGLTELFASGEDDLQAGITNPVPDNAGNAPEDTAVPLANEWSVFFFDLGRPAAGSGPLASRLQGHKGAKKGHSWLHYVSTGTSASTAASFIGTPVAVDPLASSRVRSWDPIYPRCTPVFSGSTPVYLFPQLT